MSYRVATIRMFDKELKRLSKKHRSLKDDYKRLVEELEVNPFIGTDLGNGVRKVRLAIASKGKGKSHGARVITYTEAVVDIDEDGIVTLLYVYDKGERDTISSAEIVALLATLSK